MYQWESSSHFWQPRTPQSYRLACRRKVKRPPVSKNQETVMKVFLDDERETPDGWHRVYWPEEAIQLLATGSVEEISLDHDLGDDAHGTGYDVILWIEEAVALRGFNPPKITIHSANASAAEKMRAGVRTIERLAGH